MYLTARNHYLKFIPTIKTIMCLYILGTALVNMLGQILKRLKCSIAISYVVVTALPDVYTLVLRHYISSGTTYPRASHAHIRQCTPTHVTTTN